MHKVLKNKFHKKLNALTSKMKIYLEEEILEINNNL
jgi:hypothetical protein